MTVTTKNVPYRLQEGDGNDLHETPGRLIVEILKTNLYATETRSRNEYQAQMMVAENVDKKKGEYNEKR